MSIKLRFQKGSYVTQVTLKDEALSGLHQLIAEHQTDEEVDRKSPDGTLTTQGRLLEDLYDPSKEQQRIDTARSWLKQHSEAEALSKIGWQTFPEKIALLG